MKNKKGFWRNKLYPLLFSSFLFFTDPVVAQEVNSQEVIESSLEEKVASDLNFKLGFNIENRNEREPLDHLYSSNYFSQLFGEFYCDFAEITDAEKNQIQYVLRNIKKGNIDSYNDLLNSSQFFSENQKLSLLSAISNLLKNAGYDVDYDGGNLSQDEFFEALQNYLVSRDETPLGACRDIATLTELLGEDLGINMESVSGMASDMGGHMWNIADLDGRTAIIDYQDLFIVDTENIRMALRAYQKYKGIVAFEHSFFDKGEFQYRFLTEEGKNYLEAIGYNGSSEVLKNSLIQRDNFESSGLEMNFNLKNYLVSGELNCFGPFINFGQLRGFNDSSLQRLNFIQTGFRKSLAEKYLNWDIDLSLITGNLIQDKELDEEDIFGVNSNIVLSTKFEKGFNLSSRINGYFLALTPYNEDSIISIEFGFGGGASYRIPFNKKFSAEIYGAAEFGLFPEETRDYKLKPRLADLQTGISFKLDKLNYNSFLDLYFLQEFDKIFGFGGDLKINKSSFGCGIEAEIKKSNYEFCPDVSWDVNVNLEMILKDVSLGIEYNLKGENYDGEKDTESSIGAYFNWN